VNVLKQSRNGSAAVILLLFAAFAFVYRRAAVARRRAERLAAENRELLTASRVEALTDALTGLGNRRALMADLDEARPTVAGEQLLLVLFDLDGFKQYNDTYGHPAGDVLLARLGERLAATMEGIGRAYRMGGDEFCVTAAVAAEGAEAIASLAAAALSEEGVGFEIGCSYGFALMPADTRRPEEALLLADQRMYAQKHSGRMSPSRQSADVLLRLLAERSFDLERHTTDVAQLAALTAERLGLHPDEVEQIRLAAELHDVGKAAIPDAILLKPGPLTDDEWYFVRRHAVIGERIVRAAPSLSHTADLVRWHHERPDGTGYPDALAGDQIPIGARVIAVADVFDAMVSDRPYREGRGIDAAIAELRRCSGSQFDPTVVDAFVTVVAERASV
jgi:diguanylate cyclase (GGDEF)-like protein